ncbi:MotA/TolQ/ExbB proton channel family protein [Planctomicrobium piriforme]|uniref:MotA/TolQ/ExbB proton channel family protein n=1 Tax=Planctomicrobium piriforme TaxID=1576369 RepID=A0A1I3CBQ1_9PLAN|nr:MotA/TolQ/ExbB proton channel family protein [Planctomicrobium piriforme]SFH71980.1 MotA/TolQ/ExbB proton channel family protein [Planctomicrobium piriforme]
MEWLLEGAEPIIYGLQILAGVYGSFCAILIYRKIKQKSFSTPAKATEFLNEVRALLERRDFDGIAELCDSPPYWSKATPQLILVALAYRDRGLNKLRQLLAEKYERDVVADLDYRAAWMATIVKIAPMLGLLGTSTGMIRAFASLAGAKGGVDPLVLAEKISIALYSTALGLAIAVGMTVLGSAVHVRKGKLTDAVQEQLSEFLYDLEKAMRT